MSQWLIGAVIAPLLQLSAQHAAAQQCDLELVLALDASGSVEPFEYELQLRGIATSLRDRAVQNAISERPGGIALNVIVWAEHQVPKQALGWRMVASPRQANELAALIEGLPRSQDGATGLGEGIAAAVRSINGNGLDCKRRVIDVSGDGAETPAREFVVLLPQARQMAQSYGIVINGLAITNEDPKLEAYYAANVQSGPGSFVMATRDYEDFAEAMRRKLLREIEGLPKMASVP